MSAVRQEKDSLGFVEVPERAYYGAQTARAVENYPISGMRAHPLLIRAFGMVKRAAAEANKASASSPTSAPTPSSRQRKR